MKIQVDIEAESIDAIMRNELKWHYDNVKDDIKKLKKLKKLEKYQREDKAYFEKLLPALEVVCDYYGVETK